MISGTRLAALAAGIALTAAAGAALRNGFELLSAQEYRSELAARHAPGAAFSFKSADIDAPTITVVRPDHTAPIHPPVDIEVRFKAAQGATVNVKTLKITYGWMNFDVTERILSAPGVQVSPDGLKANGAQLPPGNHKLVIAVADNYGRTGRQPVEFTVTK
jgi:hypothetical protein